MDNVFVHKPNTGSLLKNDRKSKDTDPSWRGDGLIDLHELGVGDGQVEVWLSIWVNETKTGGKRLKLSINPKKPLQQQAEPVATSEEDDDIPW